MQKYTNRLWRNVEIYTADLHRGMIQIIVPLMKVPQFLRASSGILWGLYSLMFFKLANFKNTLS